MSLWQKPESDQSTKPSQSGSTASKSTASSSQTVRESRGGDAQIKIGPSIEIKGELNGNEDLCIDGKVDGRINLKDHNLTVGANGRINAEIHAKGVLVVGEVVGNIVADDKIEIAPSGSVEGDLCAPRVALADGSSFKGAIDMSRKGKSSGSGSSNVNRDMPMAAKS
jgi:cytoskeletal protein CcmA (bactofilin family)